MGSVTWGREVAEAYDTVHAYEADRSVLDPIVDLLTELARGGNALEFGVGTGRVALALSARGVSVSGIELSPHMAAQLAAKRGAEAVPVTVGDMTSARVAGSFTLVYLVANSLMNLTTQEEQVGVFANAAAHLAPGGRFVLELIVPELHHASASDLGRVFTLADDHVGIETFDDPVGQIAWSHHWMQVEGRLVRQSAPYRYVWPSELELMARLTGFTLESRWAGWMRETFTAESTKQVAVFEKTA